MLAKIPYGRSTLSAEIAGTVDLPATTRSSPQPDVEGSVWAGLQRPIDAKPITDLIHERRAKTACILVSDATRPVPNESLLRPILRTLESAGIHPYDITILIATGLHRVTTDEEKRRLLGPEIPAAFTVVDHDARDASALIKLGKKTPAGATVHVNRRYAEADVKIATGLIEPHFMLGYSGGRKSVCPGIVDLRTVQRLHGPTLLGSPQAKAGVLDGNPCHEEALAVARLVGVDLIVNVTIDRYQQVVGVYVGDVDAAHRAGVTELEGRCRLEVFAPADVVITSAGGYPLDATFYQAVKGFVAPLDVVKPGGVIICCAACGDGIGSDAYRDLMLKYDGNYKRFLKDIRARKTVHLDQWEYQMHARVLEKVGVEGLFCVTDGIGRDTLARLSVTPPEGEGRGILQATCDAVLADRDDPAILVLPEGPYCIPVLVD